MEWRWARRNIVAVALIAAVTFIPIVVAVVVFIILLTGAHHGSDLLEMPLHPQKPPRREWKLDGIVHFKNDFVASDDLLLCLIVPQLNATPVTALNLPI